MEIRILDSGISAGALEIGCTCVVCISRDPRDHHLRTSMLVQIEDATLLLDCGPGFREQMLHVPFNKTDTVLIPHKYCDRVGGLDDLHPSCRFEEVSIYAETYTAKRSRSQMSCCFVEHTYPGVPNIPLYETEPNRPFFTNHIEVLPLRVVHGKLPILGYRTGKLGYITDMLTMPDESFEQLQGVGVLVMNTLRITPHSTHQSLSETLKVVKRIRAKET